MLRYIQRATEAALGIESGVFLERFKALGWFLDDLVLTPVNAMPKAQRMTKCLAAQASLTERIRAISRSQSCDHARHWRHREANEARVESKATEGDRRRLSRGRSCRGGTHAWGRGSGGRINARAVMAGKADMARTGRYVG